MMFNRFCYVFALGLITVACAQPVKTMITGPQVFASMETAPVASSDDAADDPALWLHPHNSHESYILGTDKQAGLYLYELDGSVKQFLPVGKLNNVDVRQGVSIANGRGGRITGDIAAASNRTDDTIAVFSLSALGADHVGSFPSFYEEPYGFCLGVIDEALIAFVAHKTGALVAYRIDSATAATRVGSLAFATQLEGCVHDDETGVLYIGEELHGIWRVATTNMEFGDPVLVDGMGGESGLTADVEGLAIYKTGSQSGYLLASSQGSNSFKVYDRADDNAFIGSFAVVSGPEIDGAEETDGIDAVSVPLGGDYPAGAFIAQDGYNDPQGQAQNFKLVDWREIDNALGLSSR